ncbi:MAG: type II toxin-antitoxin system ParD family antitoxin [Hormoscilla sp.]
MNIQLTPELEQFVQSTVNSGRYSDPYEVVRTALQLLEEREMERLVGLSKVSKAQYNAWGKLTTKKSISTAIASMGQLRQEVGLSKTSIREMIEEGRRY